MSTNLVMFVAYTILIYHLGVVVRNTSILYETRNEIINAVLQANPATEKRLLNIATFKVDKEITSGILQIIASIIIAILLAKAIIM